MENTTSLPATFFADSTEEMLDIINKLITEVKANGGLTEYTKAKELTEDLHQAFCRKEWIAKVGV